MLAQFTNTSAHKLFSPIDMQPVVYVVDDDVSVREALESLVGTAGLEAEIYASGEEFLRHVRRRQVSCVLLDNTLPKLNGLEIQQRLAGLCPGMSIIFITGHGDVPTTVKAMKAGAHEFLIKPFDNNVLLVAIKSAIRRSRALLTHEARVSAIRVCYQSLSVREREVMDLVVRGLMNKQIAAELGISETTVKAHRGRAMRKMHADSLADLVKKAAVGQSQFRAGGYSSQSRVNA